MSKLNELNKKLAKWAGFIHIKGVWWRKPSGTYGFKGSIPIDADIVLPSFTDPSWGMAYCFKWLVPRIYGYMLFDSVTGNGHCARVWSTGKKMWEVKAGTPSLALCLAIEKLIDNKGGE